MEEDAPVCRDTLKPPDGYYTVEGLRKFLGFGHTREVHAIIRYLGIELGPFVRDEWYIKKVYKRRYRWLNSEEAKRIVARAAEIRVRKRD
jgi:hypothetical protein